MEERRKSQRDGSRTNTFLCIISNRSPNYNVLRKFSWKMAAKSAGAFAPAPIAGRCGGIRAAPGEGSGIPPTKRDRGGPDGRRSDKTTKLQVVLDEVVVFSVDGQGPILLAAGLCGHHAGFIAVNPGKIIFHHDTTPLIQNLHPQPLYGAAPLL